MGNLRFRQIHLDFHTSEKIKEVGNLFDPDDFSDTLLKANVNSINLTAKCCHGMLYYNTSFPAKHPGLKFDLFGSQVKACAKKKITTVPYIVVGWDEYMSSKHPEYIQRTPSGKPFGLLPFKEHSGVFTAEWINLCLNTPYVEYIKEIIKEIFEKYGEYINNHIFLDIIWRNPCCCKYCIEGMDKRKLNPENLYDRLKFADDISNNFKQKMVEYVRSLNKNIGIFFNEGHIGPIIRKTLVNYSHIEIEALPSNPLWGYSYFPIAARYVRNLEKEYLGQTAIFLKSWGDFGGYKNIESIEHDCISMIANGAKCMIGDQLHPNGQINKPAYELIGSVFKKVKELEEWSDDVKSVSRIGLFHPEAVAEINENLPQDLSSSLKGAYRMLKESHYQFDILDQEIDFKKYSVIILPDVIKFDKKLKNKFQSYIKDGGKLLISYKSAMDINEKEFLLNNIGIKFIGDAEYSPDYIEIGEIIRKDLLDVKYVMYKRGLWIKSLEGAVELAKIWNPYFNRSYKHFSGHVQTPVEKESKYPAIVMNKNIIYFAHPIFSIYQESNMRAYRQILINCLNILYSERIVYSNAPSTAEIIINFQPKKNRYILHILHFIPERRSESFDTVEDIIPLYNIEIKIKLPKKPVKVYYAPELKDLNFNYDKNGYCNINIPKVKGHEVVVFE